MKMVPQVKFSKNICDNALLGVLPGNKQNHKWKGMGTVCHVTKLFLGSASL